MGGGRSKGTAASPAAAGSAEVLFWSDARNAASGAVPAFPNIGVSLGVLNDMLADDRLTMPMYSLPVVGADRTLTEPRTAAELEALDLAELRGLAKTYRVFSERDGGSEFAKYDGAAGTRRELLAGLRKPPTTTTQVNICFVKPDTVAAGCSYAAMIEARGDGDGKVGEPTIFLSHAWRFNFRENVEALSERFAGAPEAERLAVRVWNDIFVEDQNSSDAKPKDSFFTAFKDAIAAIGHTVLVLSPWHDLYRRARRARGKAARA